MFIAFPTIRRWTGWCLSVRFWQRGEERERDREKNYNSVGQGREGQPKLYVWTKLMYGMHALKRNENALDKNPSGTRQDRTRQDKKVRERKCVCEGGACIWAWA
jgi:hypothetical protein